jgi:hypothetical protein
VDDALERLAAAWGELDGGMAAGDTEPVAVA